MYDGFDSRIGGSQCYVGYFVASLLKEFFKRYLGLFSAIIQS